MRRFRRFLLSGPLRGDSTQILRAKLEALMDAAYRHEQLRLTFLEGRKNRLESKKYLKLLRQELKAEHERLNVLEGVSDDVTDEELLRELGVL